MNDEQIYDEWIANRRKSEPPNDLADRVMSAVEKQDTKINRHLRLVSRMNDSLPIRCAACVTAVAFGSLPFLVVAYVAMFVV